MNAGVTASSDTSGSSAQLRVCNLPGRFRERLVDEQDDVPICSPTACQTSSWRRPRTCRRGAHRPCRRNSACPERGAGASPCWSPALRVSGTRRVRWRGDPSAVARRRTARAAPGYRDREGGARPDAGAQMYRRVDGAGRENDLAAAELRRLPFTSALTPTQLSSSNTSSVTCAARRDRQVRPFAHFRVEVADRGGTRCSFAFEMLTPK